MRDGMHRQNRTVLVVGMGTFPAVLKCRCPVYAEAHGDREQLEELKARLDRVIRKIS